MYACKIPGMSQYTLFSLFLTSEKCNLVDIYTIHVANTSTI